MGGRIAIAHADDPSAGDFKADQVCRSWYGTALRITDGNRVHRHVGAVGIEGGAIRSKHELGRRAGGLDAGGFNDLAAAITAGFERAGLIDDAPGQMSVDRHIFFSE